MSRIRIVVVAAVATVVGLGAAFQAGSASHRALPDPTIAMVRVADVINGLEEIKARENQLQTFIADRDAKVSAIERQFEAARSEFDILPAGAAKRAKAEDLERFRAQARIESELAKVLIDRRRGEIFAELFQKIDASVEELAKSRGYTLVVTDDQGSFAPPNPSEQQARGAIYTRRVMFADPAIDITDELVTLMNNKWQMGQGN